MGIKVNVAQFEAVQTKMRDAARGKFLPQLAARMGAAATKLLADEFRSSRDPYDQPWAPVFRRRRRDVRARARRRGAGQPVKADKPLIDTGRLRAAAVSPGSRSVSGGTLRIVIPVDYASYHQEGTRTIPRRQILPEASTGGLGPRWTAALNREAAKALAQAFGAKSSGPEED